MTNRTAAIRYARALLDVAVKEKAPLDQIGDELAAFVDLFKRNPALEKVMLNPAVPVPRKRAAMTELVERARLSPILAKLLALLAERDRLVLLPDLLSAYRERLLDYQQVVRAEVMSFFFSSRRRHTRSLRDWSSDVCSSDLRRRPSRRAIPAAGRDRDGC